MKQMDPDELWQAGWRRPLTPEESARLDAIFSEHPARRLIWEEEMRLKELLRELPDAPLASNFTSRVLQDVRAGRAVAQPGGESTRIGRLFASAWARVAVFASVAAMFGGFFYHQHQVELRRERAESLSVLAQFLSEGGWSSQAGRQAAVETGAAGAAAVPIDVLKNFDAIYRMNQAHEEAEIAHLLTALQ